MTKEAVVMKRTNEGAFTLLELIIVIIIVGILSSLAIPKYFKMVENARVTEAIVNIRIIREAMERCLIMTGNVAKACRLDDNDDGPANLDIENPSYDPGAHFSYNVFGLGLDVYGITVFRNALDGGKVDLNTYLQLIRTSYNNYYYYGFGDYADYPFAGKINS